MDRGSPSSAVTATCRICRAAPIAVPSDVVPEGSAYASAAVDDSQAWSMGQTMTSDDHYAADSAMIFEADSSITDRFFRWAVRR
jgi:hypothetical protein